MSSLTQHSWQEVVFDQIVKDSAFGPRFPGTAYADDGNIATLRTTDISADGHISYDTMPLAQLDEATFANHFLVPGDLVITRSGRIGTTAIFEGYDKLVLPGAFLIRFRLSEEANSRFFCYWFNSTLGQQRLLSVARGAAQQNINITNVKTLKVPLPPLQGQESIVSILSAYDDLIENNRRRIQLLEQAARLLYKEWFVHLRFPGHEHTQIIDGVPEGWEKKPLGTIAPLKYGKALKNDDRVPGPFPVYGSSGIVGTHTKALVPGPTIIVGRKGNVGSVYWSPDDCHPIDTVYYIDSVHCSFFLYYTLQQMTFISTDVAVPGLNRDFAQSRSQLVADQKILRLFEDTVSPLHQQMELLKRQNASLTKARDLLLPKLMNGEVAV
jgi:type I restriction enzyme S subunit